MYSADYEMNENEKKTKKYSLTRLHMAYTVTKYYIVLSINLDV